MRYRADQMIIVVSFASSEFNDRTSCKFIVTRIDADSREIGVCEEIEVIKGVPTISKPKKG